MKNTKFLLFAVFVFLASNVFGQSMAITNARIVTVSGVVIDKGTVVIRDGLIESVGASAKIPADARIIDAAGSSIYPGFVDANTSIGLPAQQAGARGAGAPQVAQPQQSNSNYPAGLRPEVKPLELFNVSDPAIENARNAGITTALVSGNDGIFRGQSALINLAGDSVSAMTLKAPIGQHVSFVTLRNRDYPNSLLGTFSAFRQMLLDAKRLQAWQKQYAANPSGLKRPTSDASLEALFPLINGEMPVVLNANTEVEINRALNLAKEFNLKAILAGGLDAWKFADRLKAANIPVLLSLNLPKKTTADSPDADPEDLDTLRFRVNARKCAANLAKAGVKFAFQTDGLRNPADFLTNAKIVVDEGLAADAAVRAMTLNAAEIFGVSDRIGTLDAGKIANLVVVKGEIFGKEKSITHVIIDGKVFEQKEPPKRDAAKPDSAPKKSVAGTYDITIEIPGQPLNGKLILAQNGEALTGSLEAATVGSNPIKNGAVTADGFMFCATVTHDGNTFEINVKGVVNGNSVTGTMNSPMGPVNFSGTKNP